MLIYKHYNEEQLNLQYNNRMQVPDFKAHLQRWETLSRLSEKTLPIIKDLPYGNLSRENLDVFPASAPHAKTLIFIHGGYWQMFDKCSFHFIAGALADYHITTVLVNYPLAPAASIDQQVASCKKAVAWLLKNVAELNGDPNQMYIAGHSAGAHLAAMCLVGKEEKSEPVSIKGICAISGIFNLIPIKLSHINIALQLDTALVDQNSPSFLLPDKSADLLVIVGAAETNEFIDQSRELQNSWKSKVHSSVLLEVPGLNHFSILDSLNDTNSLAHKALCKQMNLKGKSS
jgi:arylformamidase